MIHTATYDGSLNFDTKIDTQGFSKGTNTIKSQANGLKSTLAGLGKMMIAAFSVTALLAFGKQAIETASDLSEVQNVVDTAFGDMAYKIEEFAKSSIDNFGLSKLAAKQMASTYMAMYRGMDQMAGTASDMAVEITGRLGDIMSFYNKTQSEVDTIGKAIATGETEPLKAIGVVATETNLSLFALQKGFKTAYSEMASDEKLLIRQMHFLDKTSMAAGDFVKTSGSWANQTRVLSERWKEFMSVIGSGLIQVLTPAVRYLNTAMSYLILMATNVGDILSSVFGLEKQVASTTTTIGTNAEDAAAGYDTLGKSAKEAGKKANSATAPFDELNQLASDAAGSAGGAIGDVSIGVDTKKSKEAKDANSNLSDSFADLREAINPTLTSLENLKKALEPIAKFGFNSLLSFYKDFLVPVGKWVLGEGLPGLLDVVSDLVSSVGWNDLGRALSNLNKALTPFAISVGKGLILFLESMAEILKPALSVAASLFADAINAIAKVIDLIPEEVAIALGGAIGGIVVAILGFNAIAGSLDMVDDAKDALGALVKTVKANPMLLLATAIGAVVGALAAYNKAKFNDSKLGKFLQKVKDTVQASKDLNAETQTMLDNYEQRRSDIESEYGAIDILSQKYFALADEQNRTNEENALMKSYADQLIEKVPELSGLIDDQTGAYKGTKEEIQACIDKSKEYYLVRAAEESLVEIAQKQFESEKNLRDLEGERKTAVDNLKAAQDKYSDALRTGYQKDILTYRGEVDKCTKALNNIDSQISTTKDTQKKLNNQWDYATDYISNYSKTAQTEIPKVEDAVTDVLGRISKDIENFKLPKLMVEMGVYSKDALGNLKAVYSYPGYATGNVVPANYGSYLAVLGDNQREPEVVSPVSTMKKAFKEAMSEMGGKGSGTINLNIFLSGKQIHSEVVRVDQDYQAQTGHSAFQPS